jgi:hypothetical protein
MKPLQVILSSMLLHLSCPAQILQLMKLPFLQPQITAPPISETKNVQRPYAFGTGGNLIPSSLVIIGLTGRSRLDASYPITDSSSIP